MFIDNNYMSIKNFHKVLQRHFEGMNLSELSRELDIPRSILQDWIQEKRLPSFKNIDYVKRLARYLGLTLDELFSERSEVKVITSLIFEDDGRKYKVNIEREK